MVMNGENEIDELKQRLSQLESKSGEFEDDLATLVELSERLGDLIERIEESSERMKNTWNPATETRIKFMKKEAKLSKELKYLDIDLAKELEKGSVSKATLRRFASIIIRIRENKLAIAREEFRYFEGIIGLERDIEHARAELKKKESLLKHEANKIQKLLSSMSFLEQMDVDMEKVRRHEELTGLIHSLENLRRIYLKSLLSKPVSQLLDELESHPLRRRWPDFPDEGSFSQLKEYFSQHKSIGQKDVIHLCELFSYSDKRLAHIIPDASSFRKTILSRSKWFESMKSLGQTPFLALDTRDGALLDFYSAKIEGARDIVSRIRQLAQESSLLEEEADRYRKFQELKEELSGLSRQRLEEDLGRIQSQLALLHSNEGKKVKKEESLFSRIASFFSKD